MNEPDHSSTPVSKPEPKPLIKPDVKVEPKGDSKAEVSRVSGRLIKKTKYVIVLNGEIFFVICVLYEVI